jgi:Xaa-Pro aminopeptidase
VIEQRVLMGGHYAAEIQPSEVYRQRRERLRAQLGAGGVAVLLGASDARGYGDVGTFRQDPTFFYLTGVELPNAVLVLRPDRDTLFLPGRRPNIEAWTGPKFGPGEETATTLGFDEVLDRDAVEIVVDARRRPQPSWLERVADWLGEGGTLWLALPAFAAAAAPDEVLRLAATLRERLPGFALRDLTPLLTKMRLVKEAGEIALLKQAAAATAAGMRAAAARVRPGVLEAEVEGAAFAALRARGAEGWAFPPIVGSGAAGCVLHYDANRGRLADGELVIVDIGARYGYYCGDLTRTFPVSGRFSDRQRALYLAVLGAYDAATAALRPGALIADVRKAAFGSLEASGLLGDGGASLGQFFIHGLGHFLGLDTHDVGGEGPTLEPGMVLTVEPGVYLPGEGVGIRVEDDWLITARGAECLWPELPRDAAAIEALVGRG